MSAEHKRQVVTVRLDDAGEPLIAGGDPPIKIRKPAGRVAGGGRRDRPIKIHVKQGDRSLTKIKTAPAAQRQAIVAALSRHTEADTLEFPVGETGEPTLAEVTGGIGIADDLGLAAQLRLPR